MKEIKIQPKTGSELRFNNRLVNKSTAADSKIQKYSWEEGQKLLPSVTLKNAKGIFDKLNITPSGVYIEINNKVKGQYYTGGGFNSDSHDYIRKSFYIKANYHGEDLLYSRRETENTSAGQTRLYSKYARVQCSGWGTDSEIDKNYILRQLKIPIDLAEIMIHPNNQATLDHFEDRDTETAPVIAPPKPGVKPETPPKRRKLGNPDVDPKPKAKLEEAGKDDILNKIVKRFNSIKHAA